MKLIPFLIAILALFVLLLHPFLSKPKVLDDYLKEGNVASQNLQPKQAIESFQNALRFSKDNKEASLGLAKAYVLLKDEDFAFKYLNSLSKNCLDNEGKKMLYDLAVKKENYFSAIKVSDDKELFYKKTIKSFKADIKNYGYAYIKGGKVALNHKELTKGEEIILTFEKEPKSVFLRENCLYILFSDGELSFYNSSGMNFPSEEGNTWEEETAYVALGEIGDAILKRNGDLFLNGEKLAEKVVSVKEASEGIAYLKSDGRLFLKTEAEQIPFLIWEDTEYFDLGGGRLVFGNQEELLQLKENEIKDLKDIFLEGKKLSKDKTIIDVMSFEGYVFFVYEGLDGSLVGNGQSASFKNDDNTKSIYKSGKLIIAIKDDETLSAYSPESVFAFNE